MLSLANPSAWRCGWLDEAQRAKPVLGHREGLMSLLGQYSVGVGAATAKARLETRSRP